MKSFIYGHIHPCSWIKITLSSKLRLYVHAQAILACDARSHNHKNHKKEKVDPSHLPSLFLPMMMIVAMVMWCNVAFIIIVVQCK
jgi:hypothetical protein